MGENTFTVITITARLQGLAMHTVDPTQTLPQDYSAGLLRLCGQMLSAPVQLSVLELSIKVSIDLNCSRHVDVSTTYSGPLTNILKCLKPCNILLLSQ